MKYTTNYSLSQYDATDRVTRSTFNSDNSKIDTAIKNAATAAATAQSTANSAQSAAAAAQSTANSAVSATVRFVTGSYTGNGEASQFIPLTPMPNVLIVTQGGRFGWGNIESGGIVYPNMPSSSITLSETGFTAYANNNFNRANLTAVVYRYLAIYWNE